jgi:hypothetical protein
MIYICTCNSGGIIQKTTNMFTRPGGVELVNESEEQLERDYAAIHEMKLFEIEELDEQTIAAELSHQSLVTSH